MSWELTERSACGSQGALRTSAFGRAVRTQPDAGVRRSIMESRISQTRYWRTEQ